MKKYLISEKGNFYKANLHCHSTISDGRLTPDELKKLYKSQGYSVLAYTDHDIFIPHHKLTDKEFVALAGFELQYNENETYPSIKTTGSTHCCFIAKSKDIVRHPDWNPKCVYIGNSSKYIDKVKYDKNSYSNKRTRTAECVNESIKKGKEAGFFVTYNHPTWSLDKYTDYISYDGMHAMEIYNNDCYTIGYNSYVPNIYDDFLRAGKRIYAISTDDNHNKFPIDDPRSDSFGGFTMIKAKELSYEAIMDSLFSGDFYASQGPEIYELYVQGNKIYISCSDVVMISLNTNLRSTQVVLSQKGRFINSAEFKIDLADSYFRLTIQDEFGKCANTNAYFLEDILKF